MPNFPEYQSATWLLWGLIGLWAILLVLGFILGKPNLENTRRLPLPARMGMSLALVISALVWWRAGAAGTALAIYGLLIFLGMSCGLLGDLFMAGVIPTFNRVIFGILAFGVGHVFYIAGFLRAGQALRLDSGAAQLAALLLFWLAAVLLWFFFVRAPSQPALMNYGTLGYSVLLAGMTALAVALAVQDGLLWPLALGASLFLASDLILGNQIMRGSRWFLISDAVWVTYTVGQMLIVFSTSAVLRALGMG